MKTENELIITLGDFKLIKSFYPDFARKQGINSNEFVIGWSELMPVVEKIENTTIQDPSMDEGSMCKPNFQVNKSIAKIWYPYENYKPFILCAASSKIEVVYKAVVEFIKWYNSQTP